MQLCHPLHGGQISPGLIYFGQFPPTKTLVFHVFALVSPRIFHLAPPLSGSIPVLFISMWVVTRDDPAATDRATQKPCLETV